MSLPMTPPPPPFTLHAGSIVSLGIAFSLMPAAQLLAATVLPKNVTSKYKYLFMWHAYDCLTHYIIEGSYLYHCFYSFIELPTSSDYPHPASLSGPVLFGDRSRRYGAAYSQAPMARLWQEYAKADRRWGYADTTIISLELLTVGLAGPAAMYICYLISQIANAKPGHSTSHLKTRLWFVATVLATGELYGGFITFAPEWLSGNTQLAGDDPVYMWLYLVFFNVLWVFIPLWVLYEAYSEFSGAFHAASHFKKR